MTTKIQQRVNRRSLSPRIYQQIGLCLNAKWYKLDDFGSHVTQKIESKDGVILINLLKPTLNGDKIQTLTYLVQVSTTKKEFSDEFHRAILDKLKEAYGNADKVNFEGDQSILNWDLQGLFRIELTIDPKNEEGTDFYSIKYLAPTLGCAGCP